MDENFSLVISIQRLKGEMKETGDFVYFALSWPFRCIPFLVKPAGT